MIPNQSAPALFQAGNRLSEKIVLKLVPTMARSALARN
jgi:hypothetical protein